MKDTALLTLSDEIEIALAHTPRSLRDRLRALFALDHRLGRLVSGTSEPMLGQMRLAWWRDALKQAPCDRPKGDAVLDAIGNHWAGDEGVLVQLVDGWEIMLAEELDHAAADKFAEGRAAGFGALDTSLDVDRYGRDVSTAGRRWALTDAAIHMSECAERDSFVAAAGQLPQLVSLPKSLRGLAILDALASRSLNRECAPLMEGRGAAITATRVAIFGS